MNRIDAAFAQLRERGETALIPFLTVGDPDRETTIGLIRELEAAGASMIELGVPYSDPLADGPVIQRASARALEHRITVEDCIRVASEARVAGAELPFILFSYFNPILQLGLDRFFELVKAHDISGLIIPDLPIEEDGEVRELAEAADIHLIPLVAPTSSARVAHIASRARGFVYCVSSLGVTGVRSDFHAGLDEFLLGVREATTLPIAIGFGISTPEQVRRFGEQCDGVVVGSAIVRRIEETLPLLTKQETRAEGLAQVGDFVRQLRS
ncbi:tryptophan synthase subunit alpha [Paenibacillus sp. IB182496]|uniref:Tryptophan synthase alpha chain n=1 Tax=Paenibacillus sabuli TaxID=2772509 RepID=A0A927BRV6_9BACL|nr:tryptophan synthase subunit alpha [Paenibacillus sabuli]MBD2845152.1 tryptophan synthase subunit alpha [Paenibacillus sabuli]